MEFNTAPATAHVGQKIRCARGHEWTQPARVSVGDAQYTFTLFGLVNERFCTECFLDLLRNECGGIEIVKDEAPAHK